MRETSGYLAFSGTRCVAAGPLEGMLRGVKAYLDRGGDDRVLFFDERTGEQLDFDMRGTVADVLGRVANDPDFAQPASAPALPRGPGRPRLGVVSREVSLLPRHWAWLERQPSGASAAIRRLVETASKEGRAREAARDALTAASKVMWTLAGDLPRFEEASRALFAKDGARLRTLVRKWPVDVRTHVTRLFDRAIELDRAA